MANKYFKALLLLAFVCGTNASFAQGGGPPPPPPGLPIDGGLLGLLALGVGFAVKKIYDHQKKS